MRGLFLILLTMALCAVGCARERTEDIDGQEAASTADDPGRPRVDVRPDGAYGTHTFAVPANAYWVNSGLFLRAGETATAHVSGTWTADGAELGPEGDPARPERGCARGALVARSELAFEDADLHCLGRATTFTAVRDGTVYFGSLAGTDLGGDFYAARGDYSGALTVRLESNGLTVPWVESASAATYDFESVASGRVELYGRHIIVVTTTAQAIADRDGIAAAIALLDSIYDQHARLRGATPFGGQRVRFVVDDQQPGYMLAGNPIRMQRGVLSGDGIARILRSADPAYDVWGFAHELGHTFATTSAANWWYQVDDFFEAWPNVFSVTALETLERGDEEWGASDPRYPSAKICPGREAYLARGQYADLMSDPHLMLCFLLELKETYGPAFYPRFFALLNATPDGAVPAAVDARWGWLRDRFSEAAGADTTPIFETWRLPLPAL